MYRPALIALSVLTAPAFAETTLMDPGPARAAALAGEVVMVDIRRPDEWASTGIADVAIPLDMRAEDFEARLADLQTAHPDAALAFICRSGGRSKRLAERLSGQGWQGIVDVAGGTLRWIDEGLPVVAAE